MQKRLLSLIAGGILLSGLLSFAADANWQRAKGPLETHWAKDVSPDNVLPEYPRPQMVRNEWQNLNGLWDYAITAKQASQPHAFDGKILVPFCVESALSGVMKQVTDANRLWYHRFFTVPKSWKGKNVLLHFGAVDWEATVYVNGHEIGTHRGGYDAFTYDITKALTGSGMQQIVVAVWDPTDKGPQPRGKQVLNPHGIFYTPTSGIWQTVWIEPVAPVHFTEMRLTTDLDSKPAGHPNGAMMRLALWLPYCEGELKVRTEVFDGQTRLEESTVEKVTPKNFAGFYTYVAYIPVNEPKLWSPDTPFLYDFKTTLFHRGKKVDEITGYFGMRKISHGKDKDGIQRLMLNDKPLFQFGPLDQGFWPDGIYTAPTDEALRYDIEMTKALGFNMARKHVKVEPDRWYYWCDKLGLLVWQDMPSSSVGDTKTDKIRPGNDEAAKQFETELKAMVQGYWSHPSIVMWVPFNEGWGQYDTPRITEMVKNLDLSRLVNNASGWTDHKIGDVNDIHHYPAPECPPREENRAVVLGEFGGLGLPVKGHTWQDEKNWGYKSYKDSAELTAAYVDLIDKLHPLTGEPGLSAAVYTQTTDCEIEVNGLMTYDRAMVKMDQATITAANKKVYAPAPTAARKPVTDIRPPATPLVACDPYFSIWSPADKLTDANTVHWTGKPHRLLSRVKIDGKTYRVIGAEPQNTPALEQRSLDVLPTRSIYIFEGAGVRLQLTFTTPALPEDINILSRPVTYVTYAFSSIDGKEHNVQFHFKASAELAVNEGKQEVEGSVLKSEGKLADLAAVKVGSKEQAILAKKGDDIRIDWGYLYLAAPKSDAKAEFGWLDPDKKDAVPEAVAAAEAAAWLSFAEFKVSGQPVSRWLMLAYDDIYSIQYMKKNLRPYWRRNGWEAEDLLKASANEREDLARRCSKLDHEMFDDLQKAGGKKYASICCLAYRQCFAAGKFVADENGQPLQFCKENHSNGCISTSDVFYPMSPQFLLLGPTLAKSFIVPFMNYAASERWKFPFAPHDLGTYPKANGQVYGDGERGVNNQMPVEESGNLLLLMGAVAEMEGKPDFANLYWPTLEKWADYLKEKGFDPENQLCTDDFAGHLAHNINLSAKAICGLGAFSKLCQMRGDAAKAQEFGKIAKEFAARWVKEAADDDHYKLAFDKSGTWSQKYNLVWDRILGLNLFPTEVARKEMDFYKKNQNKYGLPLDNRKEYTKLDWTLWTATLTQDRADFQAIVDPVYRFCNETPDRSPLTDWYETKTAKKVGFTGRPVIGGVFLQMLYDKAIWQKWAKRDQTKASNWAPMPLASAAKIVIPTAQAEAATWRYTFAQPVDGWFKTGFDDSQWTQGPAGFGKKDTPGAVVRTDWGSEDIWLRREIAIPEGLKNPKLIVHHDEDAQIYINGVLAAKLAGFSTEYEEVEIKAKGENALKPGKNLFAVHCHQTGGGQYIDLGIAAD